MYSNRYWTTSRIPSAWSIKFFTNPLQSNKVLIKPFFPWVKRYLRQQYVERKYSYIISVALYALYLDGAAYMSVARKGSLDIFLNWKEEIG